MHSLLRASEIYFGETGWWIMGGFLEEQTEATKYLEYLSILEKIDS